MKTRTIRRALWIGLAFAVACGSGSSGTAAPGAEAVPQETCVDTTGTSVTCPIVVAATTCAQGDANACLATTTEAVTVGGTGGPCLHVIIANRCAAETFTNTCIEHTTAAGKDWQCWVSSTPVGATIDVAQCGATGRTFHYGTTSSGQLQVLDGSCPKPM